MSPELTVIESWKMAVWNAIFVDIMHSIDGLPPGTVLASNQSGKKWKVLYRVIFFQADNQKRFANEKEQVLHFSFKSADAIDEFINRISNHERKGIYQYAIAPIDHDDKPSDGESLILE